MKQSTNDTLPSSHLSSSNLGSLLLSAQGRKSLGMKLSTPYNTPLVHYHYRIPTCSISCGAVLFIPASLAMAEYRSVTLEERGRE